MYPAFIKDAEEAGDKKALNSFHWANESEKVHEVLYREALASPAGSPARNTITTFARFAVTPKNAARPRSARCAAFPAAALKGSAEF